MNAEEYCDRVDRKVLLHKELMETMPVIENHSPLISLKDSTHDFIFEPSINKEYHYLVREEIFEKIGRISERLKKDNKLLVIRSVWRSFYHQKLLWDNFYNLLQKKYPDKQPENIREMTANFIAVEDKSMHATGGAVDVLIYDRQKDIILDFGTNRGYKIDLNKKCYPYHPGISPLAKKNRKLLIGLFEDEDFVCDLREYWHFDYGNAAWAVEKKREHAFYGIIMERETKSDCQ